MQKDRLTKPHLVSHHVRLHWTALSAALIMVILVIPAEMKHHGLGEMTSWSQWSRCSTSCGHGQQTRTRVCLEKSILCRRKTQEERFCMTQFCPSYLSWPRFHFYGKLATDISTVNNIRCNYDTRHFVASAASKGLKNWSPDGSGHVYFADLQMTSSCWKRGKCSESNELSQFVISEGNRGVIVDPDPDWKTAPEIWGFSISVSYMFEARMARISCRKMRHRIPDLNSDSTSSVVYKSKLTNIVWRNEVFRHQFNNATELSISFTLDMFSFVTMHSRVTGTIGLTSSDDPRLSVATRVMRGVGSHAGVGYAPFFVYYDSKILTIDFSNSLLTDRKGNFIPLGTTDLMLRLSIETYCRYLWTPRPCAVSYTPGRKVYHRLTHNGIISKKINSSSDWYKKFGGVMDISLVHLKDVELRLLRQNRLAVVEVDKKSSRSRIFLIESKFGINFGVMGPIVHRLESGQRRDVDIFVSKYGKPAAETHVDFESFLHKLSLEDAADCPFHCNKTIGWPKKAISIEPAHEPPLTNDSGLVKYIIRGIHGPGSPRKCGLDGQLYPTRILVKYKSHHKSYVFMDGSPFRMKDPNTDVHSFSMITLLFDDVKDVECPTWRHVKDIFEQYYNLYPVMRNHDMIDLHSYEDIKSKARSLKSAMFDFEMGNPRYMPVQRDMSYGKRKLIWNWMRCGMKMDDNLTNTIERIEQEVRTVEEFNRNIEELRQDIQNAIFVEFATIPPYLTAWLSIKREEGQNRAVADIIKNIMNEEMRHMTLSTNLLNAIGGKANFVTNKPSYPCDLSLGSLYGLNKGQRITLGKMTIGRVRDVFSAIEQPVSDEGKMLLESIAHLWKLLSTVRPRNQVLSRTMKNFLQDNLVSSEDLHQERRVCDTDVLDTWRKIHDFARDSLAKIPLNTFHTVGGFYTKLALKLAYLEALTQLQTTERSFDNNNARLLNPKSTIFEGEIASQVNMTHWYERATTRQESESVAREVSCAMSQMPHTGKVQERQGAQNCASRDFDELEEQHKADHILRGPFSVTDLESALRAVIEIVYEGEGGSGCSPFENINENHSDRLSHYYRFQEIVHGKRLIKVREDAVPPSAECLLLSKWCRQFHKGWAFCYLGEPITFHEDGVWPIISDPEQATYYPGTRAYILNRQFYLSYSRLLRCLNKVFNGNPAHMHFCMSDMHDLTIIGRSLVATSVEHTNSTSGRLVPTSQHGAPSFTYVHA